jgi:hypothetical protein
MAKPDNKVQDEASPDAAAQSAPASRPTTISPELEQELDEDEAEFRAIRKDLPGVKGASAAGIVAISVGKIPTKNEFFRSHKTFRPVVPMVDHEVGMVGSPTPPTAWPSARPSARQCCSTTRSSRRCRCRRRLSNRSNVRRDPCLTK